MPCGRAGSTCIQGLKLGPLRSQVFTIRGFERIFPALVGMLFGTTILAYLLLFPREMIDYAKSLFASVLSFSNFYFWLTSDYFAPGGEKPLLHTWSLAVEEQFYILLPPFLLLLKMVQQKTAHLILALTALCSLIVSAFTVFSYPEATFYLLPTRAWELALGGMLGIGMIRFPESRFSRQALGVLGLALVAFGCLRFTSKMPFPELLALVPVRRSL